MVDLAVFLESTSLYVPFCTLPFCSKAPSRSPTLPDDTHTPFFLLVTLLTLLVQRYRLLLCISHSRLENTAAA